LVPQGLAVDAQSRPRHLPDLTREREMVEVLRDRHVDREVDRVAPPADQLVGSQRRLDALPRLLKRVFDIDIERCLQCGGNLKIIAAIEEPAVIERILTHLGLCAQPPPRTPARRLDLFQAA
jgi:hypothetical protein